MQRSAASGRVREGAERRGPGGGWKRGALGRWPEMSYFTKKGVERVFLENMQLQGFKISPKNIPNSKNVANKRPRTLGTLRTFTWNLGNLGNLYLGTLGTLGETGFGAALVCSETFTMAEDPKASAVGEK